MQKASNGVHLIAELDAAGAISRLKLEFSCSGFRATGPEELKRWMQAYAAGVHLPFNLAAPQVSPFQTRVLKHLNLIPFGKVQSYGEVADAVGSPGAARAVGTACGGNPFPLIIPCHRVIAAGGKLGGYGYGLEMKQVLLNHERSFGIATA